MTSPDAPGLDIYQNGSAMAYNLGFGTVTSYVSIPAGVSTITADTATVSAIDHATIQATNDSTVTAGSSSLGSNSNNIALNGIIATNLIQNSATAEVTTSMVFDGPPRVEIFGTAAAAVCEGTLGPHGAGAVKMLAS